MNGPKVYVVLYQPEIPQNTGNIARTCAATGTELHLIEPLGFSLQDKYLKRAGLDYWEMVKIHLHKDFQEFLQRVGPKRCLVVSKKGRHRYDSFLYREGDALVFGSETMGCPDVFLELYESLYIPMRENTVRCLNLSTSVGIVLFRALTCLKAI